MGHEGGFEMTDTANRVLSLDEVMALEEGARVWVELYPGILYGCAKEFEFSGLHVMRRGMLRNESDEACRLNPSGPGHRAGNFRVWQLPKAPTKKERKRNPWRKEGEASE